MKRFIAHYFLFLLILFVLFYASFSEIATFINTIQSQFTLIVLDVFLKPNQLVGIDIWINPQYKIVINKACNGMMPLLFLYASLLAYPSSLKHKFVWMLGGYIIFFMVNIIRILWVVFVTENGQGQGDFYWSHDIVGNTMLMLTGLGLFISFIKTATKDS